MDKHINKRWVRDSFFHIFFAQYFTKKIEYKTAQIECRKKNVLQLQAFEMLYNTQSIQIRWHGEMPCNTVGTC
jgi:hypothetical protein